MKKFTLIFILLLAPRAMATTVYMRNGTGSKLNAAILTTGYIGYGCDNMTGENRLKLAGVAAGTGVVSLAITPSSTAPPCQIGGTPNYVMFATPPLSSGVTISANIDFNISCDESNASLNAGMRMIVYRWSALLGGKDATIITSASTAECNNTRLAIAAAAPTSTTMAVGDRIVFLVEITNVGGAWGGNGSQTVTFKCEAAAAALGDSFANFADTLSFSADSNNGRAIVSRAEFFSAPPRAVFAATPGLPRRREELLS